MGRSGVALGIGAVIASGVAVWFVIAAAACKAERVNHLDVELGLGQGVSDGLGCERVPGEARTAIFSRACTHWSARTNAGDGGAICGPLPDCLLKCESDGSVLTGECLRVFKVVFERGPDAMADGGADGEVDGGARFDCDIARENSAKWCECLEVKFSAWVDLVQVPGSPGCRTGELKAACGDGGQECRSLAGSTRCQDIPLSFDAGELSELFEAGTVRTTLIKRVREQFDAMVLTENAPETAVMAHLVARSEACDAQAAPPKDPRHLIGCAYSCPLVLSSAASPVSLDLDTLGSCSEVDVMICAAFGRGAQ